MTKGCVFFAGLSCGWRQAALAGTVLLAGCQPPAAGAPSPAAPPAVSPAPVSALPLAGRAASAIGEPPAAVVLPIDITATSGRTVFRAQGDGLLVALACSAAPGMFAAREACLGAIQPGAPLRLATGASVTVRGPTPVACAPSGETVSGTAFAAGPAAVTVVDWAASEGLTVEKLGSPDGPSAEVADADRKRLQTAIQQAKPGARGKLQVSQAVATDLDGDGAPERLWAVQLTRGESEETYVFSGVFIESKDGGLRLATQSDSHRFRVLAAVDLDGDGRSELILWSAYYEGDETAVVRWTEDGFEVIGSWGCGA